MADYVFGMSLIFILTSGIPNQTMILTGAFMATLPDFIMTFSKHFPSPLVNLPLVRTFNKYHSNIQFNVRLFLGFLTGTATSLAAIILIARH